MVKLPIHFTVTERVNSRHSVNALQKGKYRYFKLLSTKTRLRHWIKAWLQYAVDAPMQAELSFDCLGVVSGISTNRRKALWSRSQACILQRGFSTGWFDRFVKANTWPMVPICRMLSVGQLNGQDPKIHAHLTVVHAYSLSSEPVKGQKSIEHMQVGFYALQGYASFQ